MSELPLTPLYKYTITVPTQALDENGHVNNVQFIAWMQEAAVRHYQAMGGVQVNKALGATWWVRSHQVEYLAQAYAGEEIEVRTWVANLRRVRSLRRYSFTRLSNGALLVRGETDWVFVDQASGRPREIPVEVKELFTVIAD
jgi:acyl-CoA thioester hydrolase